MSIPFPTFRPAQEFDSGIDYWKELMNRLGIGSGEEIEFGNELEPYRQAAVLQLLRRLSPGSFAHQAGEMDSRMADQATQQGGIISAMLGKSGFGESVQAAGRLGALNRGQEQANEFRRTLFSPQTQANAAQAQLGAIGANQVGPRTQLTTSLLGMLPSLQQGQQVGRESGGGLFGDLLGIAGNILPSVLGVGGGASAPARAPSSLGYSGMGTGLYRRGPTSQRGGGYF